jgi:hypothetical protein
VTTGLDELKNLIDCLERVGEVASIVEPFAVTQSLTDIEVVDTARERVKSNND